MTRLALLLIVSFFIAVPASGQKDAARPDVKPIPFDKKSAVSPKDVKLAAALAMEPVMTRGVIVEAPLKTVKYMMDRPTLTSRLMAEYGLVSGEMEKEEDGDGWTFTGESGARYLFRPVQAGKDVHFVRFFFVHSAPIGIGLKMSGAGAVVLRASKGRDPESAVLDFDVYFKAGERPLDKVAGRVLAQMGEAVSDFSALAESFGSIVEMIHEDPESVADEMRDADETFTKKEVESFEMEMGVKRRGKTR